MRINRNLLAIVVVAIVVVGGLLFLQSRSVTAPASAVRVITPAEYQSQLLNSHTHHLLLDVRTPEEFSSGHIAGAVNISVDTLKSRLNEVPRDQPVVVYCHSGNRSKQAAQILADAGYSDIRNLGGITTWVEQGFPIV